MSPNLSKCPPFPGRAPTLNEILREALLNLAFQAPDMSSDVVDTQARSHLRNHPDPLKTWEEFRLAYDNLYDIDKGGADPYEYGLLGAGEYSPGVAREIVATLLRTQRDELLQTMINLETGKTS